MWRRFTLLAFSAGTGKNVLSNHFFAALDLIMTKWTLFYSQFLWNGEHSFMTYTSDSYISPPITARIASSSLFVNALCHRFCMQHFHSHKQHSSASFFSQLWGRQTIPFWVTTIYFLCEIFCPLFTLSSSTRLIHPFLSNAPISRRKVLVDIQKYFASIAPYKCFQVIRLDEMSPLLHPLTNKLPLQLLMHSCEIQKNKHIKYN